IFSKLTCITRWGLHSALCFALVAGGAGVAQAGIIFQTGNNPQPGEENILLNDGDTGTTVSGVTNQSGLIVDFSSTTDTLVVPSGGQARIEAEDGLVNNITITVPPVPLGSFNDFIVNPFNGSGTATLTAIANEPGGGTQTFTFTYQLGNG